MYFEKISRWDKKAPKLKHMIKKFALKSLEFYLGNKTQDLTHWESRNIEGNEWGYKVALYVALIKNEPLFAWRIWKGKGEIWLKGPNHKYSQIRIICSDCTIVYSSF